MNADTYLSDLADQVAQLVELHLAVSADVLGALADSGVPPAVLARARNVLGELQDQARELAPLTSREHRPVDPLARAPQRLWPPAR